MELRIGIKEYEGTQIVVEALSPYYCARFFIAYFLTWVIVPSTPNNAVETNVLIDLLLHFNFLLTAVLHCKHAVATAHLAAVLCRALQELRTESIWKLRTKRT